MKKIFSFVILITILAGSYIGCDPDNDEQDNGKPPVLPPVESMAIDFSNFSATKKSAELISEPKGTENSNWEFTATVAGIWKLILNTTLAVPVVAFEMAVNQNPVFISGKKWQWSYNVTYLTNTYKARLTGEIRSSDVQWKMYITKEGTGGFTEFLWFEGTSNLDGLGGKWTLYESPVIPDALLQIDWTKTATAVGYLKYTYVKNTAFKTSYIEYGLTANALNAYYTIHYWDNIMFSDVNVEWSTTHNGRVKSVGFFGDANWYCWDSNYLNVVCP